MNVSKQSTTSLLSDGFDRHDAVSFKTLLTWFWLSVLEITGRQRVSCF